MSQRRGLTPLGAVVRGALAGAVGTAAMDLLWYVRYRRGGGDSGFGDWEFSAGLHGWDDAPAPGRFGRRVIEGIFNVALPPERARLVTNVTHWATGIGSGAVFGIVGGSLPRVRAAYGAVFGAGVWVQSYAVLVPAKVYQPPWRYGARTELQELSAHLLYGFATVTAFRLLAKVSLPTRAG